MRRLPGLLLLIVIAVLLVSGYSRAGTHGVSRHAHHSVFDVFAFEALEEVAARGASAADASLSPPASSAS